MNSNLHRLPMPLLLLAVITALWLSTLSAARAAEADRRGQQEHALGAADQHAQEIRQQRHADNT